MTKVEKLLNLINEKYKHVKFKNVDRAEFERMRAEENKNYDRINIEAVNKAIIELSKSSGKPVSKLRKIFKDAIDKKAYSKLILTVNSLIKSGDFEKKDLNELSDISKEFGNKMAKLNLDLVADDKELDKEGFFKKYPHLKK